MSKEKTELEEMSTALYDIAETLRDIYKLQLATILGAVLIVATILLVPSLAPSL